ncbi:MAG: hypothetical protein KAW92_10570 [Candidatus Cloacimonetes bacterium]|nr:hypothetical protein [Candidatus Cloacimonadota bacterium]
MKWKCLDYSEKEIKEASDDTLKAWMLTEWGSCQLEKPPKEFGKFSVLIIKEMKKRGIDYMKYIG